MVRARVVLAMLVAMVALAFVAPAAAQDDDPAVTVVDDSVEAQPDTQIVRDDDTSATVQRIRRNLVGIAVLTSAGLVVYIWHTSPARRLRVAAARIERATDSTVED